MTDLHDVVRRALRDDPRKPEQQEPLTGIGILGPRVDDMVVGPADLSQKELMFEATNPFGEWVRCERDLLVDVEAAR